MALTTCKECKKQISDSAGRCPSCGAKIRKPLSAIHWIGIIVLGAPVLLIFFAGLVTDSTSDRASNSSPSAYKYSLSSKESYLLKWIVDDEEKAFVNGMETMSFDARVVKVTAKGVAKKYADNEVAADQEYKGKIVLLEGIVQDIQSGIGDDPFLVFKGVNMFMGPHAKFKRPDIQRIAAIRKGEKQRLVCVAAGEAIGNAFFRDCVFLDVYAAELKPKIMSDIDQYLQSGSSGEKSIPMLVTSVLMFAKLVPDDSPCFSDATKCMKALEVKVSEKDREAALRQSLDFMKSKGLYVPDLPSAEDAK